MARFIGDIQGRGKKLTQTGTNSSGISGHIRGWDVGAKVILHVNSDGEDVVTIYLTSGSHEYSSDVLLGEFRGKDLELLREGHTPQPHWYRDERDLGF